MPGFNVNNVELFQAGTRKGKTYTEKDLDDIVRNFRQFSTGDKALVKPPLVIGHEEDQELLHNTGIPRMGTLEKCWKSTVPCKWCERTGKRFVEGENIVCPSCEGTGVRKVLMGNFAGIPKKIAHLIQDGAYNDVSAEIYDEKGIPEGVPAKSKMLRRIAALGGELPHVKSLDNYLQATEYSEFGELSSRAEIVQTRQTRDNGNGSFTIFSEVRPMGRDEIIQQLVALGGKADQLQALPDDTLTMIAQLIATATANNQQMSDDKLPEEDKYCLGKMAEDEVKKLEDMAKDDKTYPVKDEDVKKLSERISKYMEYGEKRYGKKFADTFSALPVAANKAMWAKVDAAGGGHKSGTGEYKDMDSMWSEKGAKFNEAVTKAVNEAVSGIKKELGVAVKAVKDFQAEVAHGEDQSFSERLVKEGRLPPCAMERVNGKPNVVDILGTQDASEPVHTFSEKGKTVTMSQRDALKHLLQNMPVFRFGEKLGAGDAAQTDEAAEVAKIEQHWTSFSEKFTRYETTKDDLVKAFKAQKKTNPSLTADKFIAA